MRVLVALVTIAALSTSVRADPSETEDVSSYRLQTAIADASVLGLALLGPKSGHGGALGALAVTTFAIGAPLVHVYHHQMARAGASLALRIGLPLLGLVIGSALGKSKCGEYCDNDADVVGAGFGALGGAILASVIDTAYLARGEPGEPTPPIPPSAAAGPSALRVGFGGRF